MNQQQWQQQQQEQMRRQQEQQRHQQQELQEQMRRQEEQRRHEQQERQRHQQQDMIAWAGAETLKKNQQIQDQQALPKSGGVFDQVTTVTPTGRKKLPTYLGVDLASGKITGPIATPEPKRHRFWAVVVFVLGLVITLGGVAVMGGGLFSNIAVLAVGLIATVFFARRVWKS